MGYKIAAIGKWHLGYGAEEKIDWAGTIKPSPNDVGFDYHWGVPRNHNDSYRCFIENNLIFGLDPNAEYRKASGEKRVQGLLSERVDD
ncbi:MAG: arylsulfatase A [Saprospiraceae bacterium]|jgi:arylsulfatase A